MGISRQQALDCLRSDDLIGVGMEADAVRRRLHPEGVVSYSIEDSIDCIDVMRDGTGEGNQLAIASLQSLYDAIRQTIDLGSTGVRLVGGQGSGSMTCGIEWFEGMLRAIRQRFPSLWIEGLSASGIVALAAGSGLDLRHTIARLGDAGLDSIASDDAASLDAVNLGNRIARPTCSLDEWLAVHRAAHGLGMRTIATMSFGAGKTQEQHVAFLEAVRQLQQETGGFTAFIPQSRSSRNPSGGWDRPTAVEQLKALAIARVFLDNIGNIQWSGATQGLKVLQMGLRFGANDAGSLALQAHGAKPANGATDAGVESAAAAANSISEEDLRLIIRDAGFQPVQRDTPYRTMFLN
ncbi:MAG: dehypoxanthine futalosine cyclase [Acidobacteriaceae bacterium]